MARRPRLHVSTPSLMTATEVEDLFIYRDSDLYWRFRGGKKAVDDPAGGVYDGWRKVGHNGARYYVHKLIWLLHHPEWDMDMNHQNTIEHMDGNRMNNDISNLQHSTRRKGISITSPGYIDVRTGKWVS